MIEVSHLTKRYGTHTAIADLSFHIEKGQIYGLLGPNGAGKSTTMNIMTGCLSASSGSVTVGGHDIFEEAGPAKRLLGYLPERPPLYLDRTPWEYLSFVGQAKGVAKEDLDEQIHHVMEVTRIAVGGPLGTRRGREHRRGHLLHHLLPGPRSGHPTVLDL